MKILSGLTQFFKSKVGSNQRNKKKSLLLFLFLIFSVSLHSQSLTAKEQKDLDSLINRHFQHSDWEHKSPEIAFGGGPSSAFLCILPIDSNGNVSKVYLMSDSENKDSIFSIFSRLKPEIFKDWRSLGSRGKTIVVPIAFSSPYGEPKYIRKIMENIFKEGEFNNVIVVPRLVFGWSYGRREFADPMGKMKN